MHNEKQLFLIREWRVDLRGRLLKKCAQLVPPGQCGNPTLLYKRYHHTSYFLLTNKQQSTNVMAKSQYGNMTKHDKSRNTRNTLSLSHSLTLSLSLDMLNNPKVTLNLTLSLTISLCHSLSLSLSHTHSHNLSISHSINLSFTHSQHAEQLLFSCLCSKVTLPLSHSLTLDMLNRASVVTNRIEKNI